jgi:hypothetical protein
MTHLELFQSHLNICDQCENTPFDLCPTGKELINAAGREADNLDNHDAAAQAIADQLVQRLIERLGKQVQVRVVAMPKMDLNIFFFKQCLNCSRDHTLMITVNSCPVGVCIGVNGDHAEERKVLLPPVPEIVKRELDKLIAYAVERHGYHEVWRGRTYAEHTIVTQMIH